MKRILSLALAAVLLLSGCAAGSGGAPGSDGSGDGCTLRPADAQYLAYALAQPVYPEFPQQPVMPLEGPEGSWEAYQEAYNKYLDALLALRGDNSGLTEAEHDALNTFASKSVPLVLGGHEGENTVYSPLSLWSALALLAQCADGASRQQVLDALEAVSADDLQETASHTWRALYTDDGMSSLILGSSIWINDAAQGTYVQETLDTLAQQYFAGTYSVPMGTAEADQAVSQWVKEQTKGLIDAPVVQTLPETLTLLVSSLYYRAAWMDAFSADQTEEDVFTDAAGQEHRVDFMHKTQNANFIRREGYQAARLSTQLGEMVFVLPDEGAAPASLLQEPDFFARLEFYGDAAAWGEVQWSVPKFDVSSDLDLMEAIAALGITDLTDPDKADLSALTDLNAFLADAKQLARVKVDEEGVEAAAVTILDVPTSGIPPENPEICVMNLNRPFLFIIRTEDIPLFVGIVNRM